MRDSSAPQHKSQLRATVRARRREIPPERRASDAEALADALMHIPGLVCARLVLGFGANAEEIDPEPALRRLREEGVRVAYPRVSQQELDLHEVADPADLVLAAYGIREPRPEAPRVHLNEIDALLVPAVAFDRRGFRLGYGGGFYDRFLARLPEDTLRIGVAFDEQLLDELPREPHDEPVDFIVTPSTVLGGLRAREGG